MGYLLDTNIISETIKKSPNPDVINWISTVPYNSIYVSVLTIGEITKGIAKLGDSKRQEELKVWLESKMTSWLEDHMLEVDVKTSQRWGRLMGETKQTKSVIDSLIAATALHHDLVLVTRNTKDFDYPGLETFNPWK